MWTSGITLPEIATTWEFQMTLTGGKTRSWYILTVVIIGDKFSSHYYRRCMLLSRVIEDRDSGLLRICFRDKVISQLSHVK